ncbi:MAG TPA: hypothetical protein PK054_12980 [Anaerohalosphaeraceae bacterium]|nr:hypothetical protein [Anaerohalosphaeraceae bacterium]HOL88141.1 hypothetical protein [Anaerohalosphaeraceae bacterium]HPP57481.1 hypothetical protein [Anaerohalosphaeraceae bacterium]
MNNLEDLAIAAEHWLTAVFDEGRLCGLCNLYKDPISAGRWLPAARSFSTFEIAWDLEFRVSNFGFRDSCFGFFLLLVSGD